MKQAVIALLATLAAAPAQALVRGVIDEALSLPEGLHLGLTHRSRWQYLDHDFRSTVSDAREALTQRSFLTFAGQAEHWGFRLEAQDSRAYASDGTPATNDIVDPFDLLQGYVAWRDADRSAQLGRFTMELGSRRLITGDEYKNTMNAFSGVLGQARLTDAGTLSAFAVVPVLREPTAAAGLEDNDFKLDRERWNTLFAGMLAEHPLRNALRSEVYAYWLAEGDERFLATRNRRLLTPGVRLYRKPDAGQVDFDTELMGQFGSLRASTTSTDDIDHRAWAFAASLGYRFAGEWKPRLLLEFDQASGDRNPGNHRDQRFDPLFGARRVTLGPTDYYGPFLRSNLQAFGLRGELKPSPRFESFVDLRKVYLDQARDAWVAAKVQDPSGASGRDLGWQIDWRWIWRPVKNRLTLEGGITHFERGRFARLAPNAAVDGPEITAGSNHLYSQIVFSF